VQVDEEEVVGANQVKADTASSQGQEHDLVSMLLDVSVVTGVRGKVSKSPGEILQPCLNT
jgi:hypothetical protein